MGVVLQYPGDGSESRTLPVALERAATPILVARSANVRVGLFGAGGFASSTLIPAIKDSSETSLISVCSATGSHAQHVARKFGFAHCTTEEAEIIRNAEINTVVIATRHHLHARQVLAALREGKSVFCEKPLCLSEDELHQICVAYSETARSNRALLMVGFNRRFAPMVQRMKSFLSSISEPLVLHYRINAGSLPPDHWVNDREQGGGRILGEVCHFVDLLTFLAGSPLTEVLARALVSSGRYSADNVIISVRFANGSEGTIHYLANGDRAFSKERIEVFGGGGTAVLDDFRHLELVRNGRKESVRSRWNQDKGHRTEWAAFADAIKSGTESPIPFEDIVASTLATIRIDESVTTAHSITLDTAGFLNSVPRAPNLSPSLKG